MMVQDPTSLRWYQRSTFILALQIFYGALILLPSLNSRGLWASHEARAALNARSMLEQSQWVIPHLPDGTPELQKPPGYYWMVAGIAILNERVVSPICVRLPAVLAAFGCMIVIHRFLFRHGKRAASWIAPLVLVTSIRFAGTAQVGRIDLPLTFAVTSFLVIFYEKNVSTVRLMLASLFLAGGLLLKGPIALVLVATTLGPWWLLQYRTFRWQWLFKLSIACLIGILLAAPWYILAHTRTDGAFTREFFLYHHLARATGQQEALASYPLWYYLPRILIDFLPWTAALFVTCYRKSTWGDPQARFTACWVGGMFLLLSLASFKRADYLLPLFPGLAILSGIGIASEIAHRTWGRFIRISFWTIIAIYPVGWQVFDHVVTRKMEEKHQLASFAAEIVRHKPTDSKVIFFQVESHQLAYHLHQPFLTMTSYTDIAAQAALPGDLYVIARLGALPDLQALFGRQLHVLVQNTTWNGRPQHRPVALITIREIDGISHR